ncbi:hypothetical protein [Flavobacterium sp.]|uniref:hypothetical protein n=1 Tax=Flavobacterium sp. TaxID=239 RepID=UPI0040484151
MNFRQQIAKYATGNVTFDQLPEIGMAGLEEGLNSPSLCILAGMDKNESAFEIEHYFKMALEELNILIPDKRQAAIYYGIAIVDEIIAGKKDVIDGTREIRYKAIDSYDFFSESEKYCYDSIGFEYAYGLFDTYDELQNADRPWQTEKTNEELMLETKTELLEELKSWKEKNKNGI